MSGRFFSSVLAASVLRLTSACAEVPSDYYTSAFGSAGATLKQALHLIVREGHVQVPYTHASRTDVWDALIALDADPANPGHVLLVYSGYSAAATTDADVWNREHLWPQSYGLDSTATKAGTDLHNLRPADATVNSRRGNLYFDVSSGTVRVDPEAPGSSYDTNSWEPRDADKGAIARAMFYMAVRYEPDDDVAAIDDLELGDSPSAAAGRFGKLSTLLAWHRAFPVTSAERQRNDLVFSAFQHNRNPFVDVPYFADLVFVPGSTPFSAWRGVEFTAAEAANASVSGDLADPDADGTANLLEYKLALPPRAPDAAPLAVSLVTSAGTTFCYLTHTLSQLAHDVTLTYEISTDLVTWSAVAVETVAVTPVDALRSRIIARFPAPALRTFVRARATR